RFKRLFARAGRAGASLPTPSASSKPARLASGERQAALDRIADALLAYDGWDEYVQKDAYRLARRLPDELLDLAEAALAPAGGDHPAYWSRIRDITEIKDTHQAADLL